MTRWEVTTLPLWLGHDLGPHAKPVHKAIDRIAALAADGWEPVGPVAFAYDRESFGRGATRDEVLLFKRPLPESESAP